MGGCCGCRSPRERLRRLDIMGAIPVKAAVSRWRVRRAVATFERSLARSGAPLVKRFGKETASVMRAEMLDEYRRLLRGFPTSGGGVTRARRI